MCVVVVWLWFQLVRSVIQLSKWLKCDDTDEVLDEIVVTAQVAMGAEAERAAGKPTMSAGDVTLLPAGSGTRGGQSHREHWSRNA